MRRIKQYFSNLKLRNKFLVSYALLLTLPLLVVSFLFYNWIATITRQQTREIAFQSVKQAMLHISHIKGQVENLGDMVFWDADFRSLLKEKDTILYEQVEEYEDILNVITNIEEIEKVHRVRLYVLDNKLYARNNQVIFSLNMLSDNQYFQALLESENKRGWTDCYDFVNLDGKKERIVSYMAILNDFDNFGQVIGCLTIDVLEKDFRKILQEIKIGDYGFAFITNEKANIISNTYQSNKTNKSIEDVLTIYSSNDSDEAFSNFNLYDTDFTAISSAITGSDWKIVYMMPTREIMKNIETTEKFTIIIIICSILLASAIAVVVSDRMTKSINEFIIRMEKAEGFIGSPIELSEEYSKDEIGQLQFHYERMIARIRNLVNENYVVKLQKRDAELRALQAQINPHFLYNVLDSINWMAIRAKALNISEMVTDLGRFYRIGLSGGKEIITIREELEHVRTYLDIQKIRFEETIEVSFSIQEEILDYPIVKLTLQPIVENAIVHGILNKPSQCGTIKIMGDKENNHVLIRILDDGSGVDFEKVRYVLSDPDSQFAQGFGIRNVNERIKLYFGQQYGLEIKREQDQWTVVEIRLPGNINI